MYNDIRLEKSLYSVSGKTFTQALAELDPDENYSSTELSGLDAFERQLKRFDIKVSGENCDMVEKFFMNTQSAVLFPEFVRRTIKQGLDEVSILPDITAARSCTDGIDFRGMSISSSGEDTAEQGAAISSTTVQLASKATAVKKFARKLSVTYEAIRKQRIEALAAVLRGLGAAVSRAINGKNSCRRRFFLCNVRSDRHICRPCFFLGKASQERYERHRYHARYHGRYPRS